MVPKTLLALLIAWATFLHAPAQADPGDRDLWMAFAVACFPSKETAESGPQCQTFTAIVPSEEMCHMATLQAAQTLNMRSPIAPEHVIVECLPFTLSAPGRGA